MSINNLQVSEGAQGHKKSLECTTWASLFPKEEFGQETFQPRLFHQKGQICSSPKPFPLFYKSHALNLLLGYTFGDG